MWAAAVAGQPMQKVFHVLPAGSDAQEVTITMFEDNPSAPGDTSAEQTGWGVSVAYKSAPDEFLFSKNFPAESTARGAFDDLSQVAAGCEGLVRQQKTEEAQKATAEFLKKCGANTGSTPITESRQV